MRPPHDEQRTGSWTFSFTFVLQFCGRGGGRERTVRGRGRNLGEDGREGRGVRRTGIGTRLREALWGGVWVKRAKEGGIGLQRWSAGGGEKQGTVRREREVIL